MRFRRAYDVSTWRPPKSNAENYQVQANWKLVLENSRECYHCGAGHPQYCTAVGFAAGVASETESEQNRIRTAAMEERIRQIGLETPPIPYGPGTWFHTRRFFLRDGFVTESMDGRPVAPLLGSIPERDVGAVALVALLNLMFEASSDYVMISRWTPAGPLLTHVQVQWLVRAGAKEGSDYEIGPLTELWRLTSEQDWKLCEDNQAGVNSGHSRPGIYTPQERGVIHFVDWYLNKIRSQVTELSVPGSV
jgi:Rieske 2Fe-2S family protein